MSATTVLIIIIVGLVLYYVGMIAYDLYMDKLKEANTEASKEELIDISDQLDSFESFDVNPPVANQPKVKKSASLACMGFRADQIQGLFKQITEGTQNETIENLRFECQYI